MAGNRAYDEEVPVAEVVADLQAAPPPQVEQAPALSAPQQVFNPADYFVIASATLNEVVGYLMERPWRETNQLLRAIDGIRSLDEYVG